jgi:hyperosmotically inducible protein
MNRLFMVAALFLGSICLANCGTQTGRVEPSRDSASRADADNTARNERDRSAANVLPGDQGETEADRQISANIRKAIVNDDSMSVNAQNVKVITSQGTVTLRGPVKSVREKEAIETKAKQVAGVSNVVNQLEVENKP